MRKPAAVSTVLAAVLAAAVFHSSGPVRSETSSKTLRFFGHDTQQRSLHLGDEGTSLGDQYIFAADLFDRPAGTKLGRLGGYCTTVSGKATAAGEILCTTSFVLGRGQIMTQGLSDSAAVFGGETAAFSITGGTGIYRNARGEGTVQVLPNQIDANYVLRIS